MAGWHDTIDVMIRLREWWGSRLGERFGDGFIQSVTDAAPAMAPINSRQPGWLSQVARIHLDNAEPFFVSEDVCDIVDVAAKQLETEPLLRTDLITTSGFVLLPRPFVAVDRRGKRINTAAFSWGPCERSDLRIGEGAPGTGTYLMLYADVNIEDDYHEDMLMVRDYWGTAGGYSLWHISPWWFGEQAPTIESFAEQYGETDGLAGNIFLWKWLQTFFRLSMQQMITAERVIPPRPYARRAKRAGRDPGVLVVKLRRSRPKQFIGGSEGEWDHRWIVRGHWRNQWYPTLGEHRQIWIVPYVKGPEDKPFKAPDLRVWTFNR